VVLACTDVRALYGGFVAVDGVSLSVEGGHILGVAGPNGAGKTTLFDVLSGNHTADGGRVELNGQDISGSPFTGASASASLVRSRRSCPPS
jgi:branched-chain amino acid transport system ATP-binding protein